MVENFLRKVFVKMGAGAPDVPQRVLFERSHKEKYDLAEGQEVELWLKPDTYQIHIYEYESAGGSGLIGISHNYALARYLMRYDAPYAYIYSFTEGDVDVEINYKR